VDERNIDAIMSIMDSVETVRRERQVLQNEAARVLRIADEAEACLHQILQFCLREQPNAAERKENVLRIMKIIEQIELLIRELADDDDDKKVKVALTPIQTSLERCMTIVARRI
jgi:hypothetical protein